MLISPVETDTAPAAIGPYSQAVKAGDTLFCSGQIPLDKETGELVPGGIEEQTRQVMHNLKQVLAAAGCGFEAVVKMTIYLADIDDFALVNQVYGEFLAAVAPARAAVQVAALPKNARVEIDAVAYLGS
jgi:2-iminobutanoate/2-iminopropanoate deaminase